MRVGIIRGDLPGPLFIADLEPTSLTNFSVDPVGQTRYVGRPDLTTLQDYLDSQGFGAVNATDVVLVCLPVGGPLDVSTATITGIPGLGAATAAQVEAIADIIAPKFVETDVTIKSFLVGNLAGYLRSDFVPDSTRLPAMALGAAIMVVENDGVTLFSAPMPMITGAVHNVPNPGDITITGVSMSNSEQDETIVDVLDPLTGRKVRLEQKRIRMTNTGGTKGVATPTSIVIPASLLTPASGGQGLGTVAGNYVSFSYTSLANGNYGSNGSIGAVLNGVVTLTGLARMNPFCVGKKLTLSGAASPGNNGTFFIDQYVSATSVKVRNLYAAPLDANNPNIRWNQITPVVFVTT